MKLTGIEEQVRLMVITIMVPKGIHTSCLIVPSGDQSLPKSLVGTVDAFLCPCNALSANVMTKAIECVLDLASSVPWTMN